MILKKIFVLFCLLNFEFVRAIPPVDSWNVPGRWRDSSQNDQSQQDQANQAQQDQASAQQDAAAQADQAAMQDEPQALQDESVQNAQAAQQNAMNAMQARFAAANRMFKNMDMARQAFASDFTNKLNNPAQAPVPSPAQVPQADSGRMRDIWSPNPPPFYPGRRQGEQNDWSPNPPPFFPGHRSYNPNPPPFFGGRRSDEQMDWNPTQMPYPRDQAQQDEPFGQYQQSLYGHQNQGNLGVLQQQRQQLLRNQMQMALPQTAPHYQLPGYAGQVQGYPAQVQSHLGQLQGHLGQLQGSQLQGAVAYGPGVDSLEQEIQLMRQLLGGVASPIGSAPIAQSQLRYRQQQQIGK